MGVYRLIIILNGPPGSGKDTIADLFIDYYKEYKKDSFKSVLYKETAAFYGTTVEELIRRNSDRWAKEQPFRKGLSPREMLIFVSEEIIKPNSGKDIFGKMKGKDWKNEEWITGNSMIVSDGGFPEEINAVCDILNFENVVVIRLHREGYDFSGDSRDYIKKSESKAKVFDIKLGTGKVGEACTEIYSIVENM